MMIPHTNDGTHAHDDCASTMPLLVSG
jgi:hypothetical protein